MIRLVRILGSLRIAVPLLIAIAAVLAWGTLYETAYGTAAVQRFVYRSWWFQALLAFLAANLAIAALQRYPWKTRHAPFVLAHLGIILILLGGILGGIFGIEGQLIIREGEAEKVLQLPGNVLVVHQPNPGIHTAVPTRFETQAWVHEPNLVIPLHLDGREVRLTVDKYYPDAVVNEIIEDGGPEVYPAALMHMRHDEQQDEVWLLARDPERFGVGWGDGHLLFLEPQTPEQVAQLLAPAAAAPHARGSISFAFEDPPRTVEVPVPDAMGGTVELKGTPYRVTFKDFFPDFVLGEQGPESRSQEPRNPAVSFVLTGPEGADAHLLFALHPDISSMHGWAHTIKVRTRYAHPAAEALPPDAFVLLRRPDSGELAAVLTGPAGERQAVEAVSVGEPVAHPWLGYELTVAAYHERASVRQDITNRSNDVKAEAIHVVAEEGQDRADAWVGLRGRGELAVGKAPIGVEYRPDERELPFTVKLLDFRKIDYPGIAMAAGFESDVQVSDPQRGLVLMRKISMNNPLRYRTFSLFQSSFIAGPVETTVLSVRSDPGTPFVYAGFLIVIGGVVTMFIQHRRVKPRPRKARA